MTQTNRILVTALAAVLAAGAFFMLVLKPKREEANTLKTQIAAAQSELDQAKALLASNQQARESYREAYAAVVRLGKAVPADDDVRSLIVQLGAAARKSKVDFRSINVGTGSGASTVTTDPSSAAVALPPGATVGPAGFPIMPFSFNFTGGFFRLSDFFHQLQDFVRQQKRDLAVTGRLLTVDSFALAPDQSGFPRMRAAVNATTYLVSPLEGATAGATAAGPQGAAGTAGATGTGTGAQPSTPGGTTSPSSSPATTTATSTGAIR